MAKDIKTVKTKLNKKDLVMVQNLSEEVVKIAEGIQSETQLLRASDLILQVRKEYNRIDTQRKAKVSPLKTEIKGIEAEFDGLLDPLSKLEKQLRKAIEDFGTKQIQVDLKKQEEIKKTTKNKDVAIPVGFSSVPSDKGDVRFRKAYRITIVDESKVPNKFKVIDEKLIQAAVEAAEGDIKIPGVEIEQSSTIALYVNEE